MVVNVKCREGILRVCDTGRAAAAATRTRSSLHNFLSNALLRAQTFPNPTCNLCPLNQLFNPRRLRSACRCQFGGLLSQNGSEGWRQGSPFLLVARVWCRHQCQGRQTWGSDDGQCSVAASSDIGHCLPPPGCSTWPRPRRWNLGLLLSAKVALFPLIIAAAGGRARAGLMWAETLGPTTSPRPQ